MWIDKNLGCFMARRNFLGRQLGWDCQRIQNPKVQTADDHFILSVQQSLSHNCTIEANSYEVLPDNPEEFVLRHPEFAPFQEKPLEDAGVLVSTGIFNYVPGDLLDEFFETHGGLVVWNRYKAKIRCGRKTQRID